VASPAKGIGSASEDRAKNPTKTVTSAQPQAPAPVQTPAPAIIPNPPVQNRAPDQPETKAPVAPNAPSANLPADQVEADRGSKRPDRTLLDAIREPGANRSAQKYKGTVLSSVYKLPVDGAAAAKTLQQFNGPRGSKTMLGA
jgi:hypothetical protein